MKQDWINQYMSIKSVSHLFDLQFVGQRLIMLIIFILSRDISPNTVKSTFSIPGKLKWTIVAETVGRKLTSVNFLVNFCSEIGLYGLFTQVFMNFVTRKSFLGLVSFNSWPTTSANLQSATLLPEKLIGFERKAF